MKPTIRYKVRHFECSLKFVVEAIHVPDEVFEYNLILYSGDDYYIVHNFILDMLDFDNQIYNDKLMFAEDMVTEFQISFDDICFFNDLTLEAKWDKVITEFYKIIGIHKP